jgi:hypothetical protein
MRTRRSLCAAAALTLACFCFKSATAQVTPAPAPAAVLTTATLPQILTNLGYEPKDLHDGSWYVTVERSGFLLPVRVVLSSNGAKLWFSAKLGSVDPDRLSVRVYRGLLSRDTGTARFYICDCEECEKHEEKELFLSQPMPNRSMSPTQVRQELDSFCENAVRLEGLWKPALSKQAPSNNAAR